MGWVIAITLFAAFMTLYLLSRSLRCVRRRRVIRAGGASLGSLVSAVFAGMGVMLIFSYLSYGRLTGEQVVSQIQFRRISPQEFQARLMIDGAEDRFFVLRGNEWQLDARVITWQPPLTVLGLEPIYQLDRLSGRYADIDREQSEARTVHSLAPALPADIWRLARHFPGLLPGIDAHYGTATYVPMADAARFEVSLSRDALIARPVNAPARAAVGRWKLPGE